MLFIGHGSPMNAIEENEFVQGWRAVGEKLPRPDAILCVSAHWETRGTMVTAMEKPATLHDFGGFPRELFEVEYPAPGSPELARETAGIITKTRVSEDTNWGLDHGCWSVVSRLYPAADVPVFQMSLDYCQAPRFHYDLARDLSPLRMKKVLILASGNLVHNLRMVAWDRVNEPGYGYDWAIEAKDKINGFILSGDHLSLVNYKSQGRAISLAVPTPDHFLPLLYALALKEDDEKVSLFNDKTTMGSLSMTSLIIG